MPRSHTHAASEAAPAQHRIVLAELARRLEQAGPKRVSLGEIDALEKKTYRLELPRTYQPAFDRLPGKCRITRGEEDQLRVVPIEAWEDYLINSRGRVREFGSEFLLDDALRNSWTVPVDSKGRMKIPRDAAEIAGLHDEAQFFVVGGIIEIWDPETYQRRRNQAYAEWRQRRLPQGEQKQELSKNPPRGAAGA